MLLRCIISCEQLFFVRLLWILNTVLDWLNICIHKLCHYCKFKKLTLAYNTAKKLRLFSNLNSREFNLKNVGGTPFQQNLTRVGNARFECEFWVEILHRWWPRGQESQANAGIHRQILNWFNLGFPLVQHPLCFHESTYILLRHIPCLKPGSALRNYALYVWRAVYLICSLLLHHQHN